MKVNNYTPEQSTQMTMKEILSSLCVYDQIGTECVYDDEDIKEHNEDIKSGKTCYCDNCFRGKTEMAISMIEMHTVLTTLVERLTNNWELLCSGTQNGLKTALLSEANELLNKMNK